MYKPLQIKAPQTGNAKKAFVCKIGLKYKLKQSKNGKFTLNLIASPIDFEM